MKIFLLLFLNAAALVAGNADAQAAKQFTLNEMAATLRVQPQANGGSLQRVPLPADLIMHSQSADLNDLRLFKSSGEPVPFALRSSESEATTTTATKVALKAFPIRESGKSVAARNAAIRIEARGDDMNVLIDRTIGSTSTNEGGIAGVLLDTRAIAGVMTNIELDIDLPPNQIIPLTVEASANLSSWETIANARSVYRFSDAGAPSMTAIDLPSGAEIKGRYLRVTWPGQKNSSAVASAVVIRGATLAMASSQRVLIAQPRRNLGAPTAATTHAQEWQLASPLRLRTLALTTEQTGTLLPVTVLGRDSDKQPWRRLADTVVFKLELADPVSNKNIVSTNAPLSLANTSVRQLKIEAPANSAGIAPTLVSAAIEYNAQEIIAAVNPSEELTVAVGAHDAMRVALPLQTIVPNLAAQSMSTFALMTIREATKFYPERLAASNATSPTERKNFILWGALLLGVGVLGAMAWGAVKQLRAVKP
jgi:Protein of unknown function (DUF3999)